MAVDWVAIKSEYVTTRISMQKLAEKYGVSIDQMKKKAAAEKWRDGRTKTAQKTHQKIVRKVLEKTSSQEADRLVRLLAIGDRLLAKAEKATEEMGTLVITKEKKAREEFDESGTKVCIEETKEVAEQGEAAISTADLQRVSVALKNLRDVMQAGKDSGSAAADGITIRFEGPLKEAAE